MAVYHILAESEPFSRNGGGAATHWVAGVVGAAGLEEETIVVCTDADESWGFPYVWVAPEMGKISLLPRPLQHPVLWRRRAKFYALLLRGFVSRLLPQDAIYVHNRPEMALAMVWAQQGRQQQNPVVLAVNDSQLASAPRPMVRHVAGRMAKVVFPTEFLYYQAFEKWHLHMRAAILPPGADDRIFYPANGSQIGGASDPAEVLYVGPFLERQGVHILIEAARLLRRRGVEIGVRLIERPDPGASGMPSRSATEEYRRKLRLLGSEGIQVEEYRGPEQIAEAMRKSVAVCCPSIENEGFGLANVEALACAVPVAASCIGGIPDVFVEGGAMLIPPGDAIALANAIERLMGRTGVARMLRREGRESFERNYNWNSIASGYVQLIGSLPYSPHQQHLALP